MSTSQNTPAPAPALALPQIERSDLEAARRFLFDAGDQAQVTRPHDRQALAKAPTVRLGITRARFRSVAKSES